VPSEVTDGSRDESGWRRGARRLARGYVVLTGWLTSCSLVIAALAVIGVLVVVASDALSRHLANGSVKGAIEWSEVLLVIAVFMGLAPAQRRGSNVATTIVLDHVHGWRHTCLRLLGFACAVLFATWLGIASVDRAIDAVSSKETLYGLARVPLWPARLAVAVGSFLLLAQIIADVLRGAEPTAVPPTGTEPEGASP
jgi:TRAP-type C4-dicarboxylate transport system permease small subunit